MIHRTGFHQLLIISLLCLSGMTLSNAVYADNAAIMALIKILHDKGSLTDTEYALLQQAAMAEDETVTATPVPEATAPATAGTARSAPAHWTDTLGLKGDMRLRYQGEDNDPGNNRSRGRVRYRLGITAAPATGWEVGAGLASGSSDPRSTNQTFSGTFSSKAINLDYAYAQYRFNDHVKAVGGKFKSSPYLYLGSDMMWDSDINPEGFSINFSHPSGPGSTFANSGLWMLVENSNSSDDPYLAYAQLGQRFGNDDFFGTLAGTWYSFRDLTLIGDFGEGDSNSDYHFNGIVNLAGEIGLKDLFGEGSRASIVADWVNNTDTASSEDTGYLIGAKTSRGAWSLYYNYMRLEQNAWPDVLPDSDRFSGLTGIKGHEIAVGYDLMKNVAVGIDYYAIKSLLTDTSQDLLQLDLSVRF